METTNRSYLGQLGIDIHTVEKILFLDNVNLTADLSLADINFLRHVAIIAEEAKCIRRQVGALIVKDGRLIASGRNGTPSGTKHCGMGGCPRAEQPSESGKELASCTAVHAEQNAIVACALFGVSPEGATIYVHKATPCRNCAALIVQSRIKRVVANGVYPDLPALELLNEAGVKVDIGLI